MTAGGQAARRAGGRQGRQRNCAALMCVHSLTLIAIRALVSSGRGKR